MLGDQIVWLNDHSSRPVLEKNEYIRLNKDGKAAWVRQRKSLSLSNPRVRKALDDAGGSIRKALEQHNSFFAQWLDPENR